MLVLSHPALHAVRRHAEAAYPHECCGLLLGRSDGARRSVVRAFPARNLESGRAHDRYVLDPADRLRGEEEARTAGLTLVGFYHSHPDHEAYFSQTDLERSEEFQWGEPWVPPSYSYLVVSVRDGVLGPRRAFQVVEGRSEEEPLEEDPPGAEV